MHRWLCFLLLLPGWVLAQDEIQLSVCQYGDEHYHFSIAGDVDGYGIRSAVAFDLEALTATGDGAELFAWKDGITQSVFAEPDAPFCDRKTEDEWHASAPSILVPAAEGWFMLDIQDAYGHWSRVTDSAHPDGIVLQAQAGFVELIGSVGQDVDPAHYRLIEVSP